MNPQEAFRQPNAASHLQHLTSFTGGSDMLEGFTNDMSCEGFVAAADGISRSKGLSRSRSSSQAWRPNFSPPYDYAPHPVINSLGNQQLALDSSFHSSTPFFKAARAQEHTSQDIELESQYSDNYPPLHQGLPFQGLLSASTSPQLHLPESPPSGSVTGHHLSSSLPRAYGICHADPEGHSGHGSQDGAPRVVISSPGHMDNTLADGSMLNSSNYTQDGSFADPFLLPYHAMAQPGRGSIEATGSATFTLSADLQSSSSAETAKGYYTSSETASTTATFPPATSRGRGKGKVKAKDKVKGKRLQVAGTSRRRRVSESDFVTPFGSPASQSLDRSPVHGSFGRRNSHGLGMMSRPHPYTSEATQGNGENTEPAKGAKPRGKRVGPLREDNRELATKRRNDRTVCIGCKMAKVMCAGREDGGVCERCASSHSSAPKPFVCAPASFFELLQQGSTALLALHVIYPVNHSTGLREPMSLPAEIHIREMLRFIDGLQRTHERIRAYAGPTMLYELDLRACWTYINSTCPPNSHPFQQFIDGLKVQKQDGWKACIRDGHGRPMNGNLCDALLALDDMAPWVRYTLVSKDPGTLFVALNGGRETFLTPGEPNHRRVIIVAAQLSRIIGRKLELQFYDHLKKVLGNPNICSKLVLDVGRTLMSLRRRLGQWEEACAAASVCGMPEPALGMHQDDTSSSAPGNRVSRIKSLCQVLYVYFCYMRRRLPPDEQEGMRTMRVWHPDRAQAVEESFPQYESIEGFEDWLQFRERSVADAEMGLDPGQRVSGKTKYGYGVRSTIFWKELWIWMMRARTI
ncbi:hypothetical protein TgHK011_009413 [Trichoderma gracile]|nr:hypothetical protein TgHK011_009413 [Trichoderma gracile]